jgi:hypothetical protein
MNFSYHKRNREVFTYKEILRKCLMIDENIKVQLMDIFLNPESDVHIIHPNIYDLLSITSLNVRETQKPATGFLRDRKNVTMTYNLKDSINPEN